MVTNGPKWLKWHHINSQRLEIHPRMMSRLYCFWISCKYCKLSKMKNYMHRVITHSSAECVHSARCYLWMWKAEIRTRLYSEKVRHECGLGEKMTGEYYENETYRYGNCSKLVLHLALIGWTDQFDRKYFVVGVIILKEQNKPGIHRYPLSTTSLGPIKFKVGATVPFDSASVVASNKQLFINVDGTGDPFFKVHI